ncbi:MAG: hypothetical protein V1722_04290 [Candidatus Micrarchaeota archaeon]
MYLIFEMIPVVIDTNVLLLQFQKRVNLEEEIERLIEAPHFFVVLEQCVDELKAMASKQRKFSLAARAALALIRVKYKVDKSTAGKPDDAMLNYCVANGGILCTLDVALRKKARDKGVKAVFLRGESHLSLA